MVDVKDLIALRNRRNRAFEPSQDTFRATLIEVDVTNSAKVAGRRGYIWFQEAQLGNDSQATPSQALNRKVPNTPGLPVIIRRTQGEPFDYEVVDWDPSGVTDLSTYTGTPLLPEHANDHIDGYDVILLPTRNLADLRTYSTSGSGLKVSVSPYGGFGGYIDYDISSSQPSSGSARYVLVYLDRADNLQTLDGDTAADLDSTPPALPAIPAGAIASAYVRIDGDQTQIAESDIIDARRLFEGARIKEEFVTKSELYAAIRQLETRLLQMQADFLEYRVFNRGEPWQ